MIDWVVITPTGEKFEFSARLVDREISNDYTIFREEEYSTVAQIPNNWAVFKKESLK